MTRAALLQVVFLVVVQIALLYAIATDAPVKVQVQPPVLMKGGAVRVTCTVPRHRDNRRLDVFLTGYAQSSRTLDGEDSRVTWEFLFDHLPCDVDAAICQVVRTTGAATAKTSIDVEGCNGH